MAHTCFECRVAYTRVRQDQLFCSPRCLAETKNRELKRARAIYRAVYDWRLRRKTAGQSLRFICREVAAWIAEDRAHQRLAPPRHDHTRDRGLQTKRVNTPWQEERMAASRKFAADILAAMPPSMPIRLTPTDTSYSVWCIGAVAPQKWEINTKKPCRADLEDAAALTAAREG